MVRLRERFILFIVVANVAILDADICKTVEALPKRLKPADDDITIQKYKEHVKEHHNAHNGCAGKGSCDQSMIGTLPTQVPAHRVVDACDSVKVFMILVFDPFLLGLRNLMMDLFVSLARESCCGDEALSVSQVFMHDGAVPPRLSGGTDCTLLQLDNPVAEDEAESRSFTGSFVNFNFELGIPPVVMSITGAELNRERSTRGDLLSMTAQKRRRIFGRPNTRQAPKLKREDAAQVRVAGDVQAPRLKREDAAQTRAVEDVQAPRLKREDVTEDAAQTRAVVDHPLHGTPAVTGTRSPNQLGESELARLRRLLQDQEKQHLEEMRALAERSALANKQVRIGLEAQIKEKERKCQEQEAKIENLEAKICKLEDCGARLTRQAEVHDLHLHGHERACPFSICC